MLNIIWGSFILVGILYALITGKIDIINLEIIDSPKNALEIFLNMFPLMILWSGIMNIAKEAGILKKMSHLFKPLFRIVFPEIPPDNPALGYIASNLTINMMGIHNASTPFGLKAMKCLQELNKNKKVATRSMITFLVFNTSGVTILATDIIAIRYAYGSLNPTLILLSTFIVNVLNTPLALLMDRLMYEWSRRRK